MTSPTHFGRYTILRPLGAGGMADVYLAHDPTLDREVAIKVPRFRSLGRFEVEARAVARLEHPAIVPLYEYGDQDGHPYIVMRHMGGGSLAGRLTRGPRPLAEALPIIERIAAALDYAHSRGVIHRDVKPGNILFDETGHAFLSDFGIARLEDWGDGRAGPRLTAVGAVPGSPAYLSPEQARGALDLDGRSDIYSLGIVVHEMLTGELPQPGPTGAVPTIARRRPDLPPAFQAIVARALAADRNARYGRAADFVADLRRVAGGSRPQKQAAGLSLWLVIAGLAAAALLGYLLLDGPPTTEGRPPTALSSASAGSDVVAVTPEPTSTGVVEQEAAVAPEPAVGGQPSAVVLGQTDRGTPIEGVRFGDGPQKLLFVGGLTGGYAPSTEGVAQAAITHFTAHPEAIPDNVTVYVIPLASPDTTLAPGLFAGRLNGDGVDVNRNWDCDWTPDPLWDDVPRPGSGGAAPFAAAETRALRDFILSESPAVVVIWYARANDGLVSPGGCGPEVLVSDEAATLYAQAAGYRQVNLGDVPGAVVNGDATNWLDSIGIPAISVLLPSFTTVDWPSNLDGITALIAAYAARPAATPLPPEVVLGLMAVAPDAAVLPQGITTATLPTPPAACDIEPGDGWRETWQAARDRLGCPANQAHSSGGAFQYFAGGKTIWRQDRDLIYVLYNDGAFAAYPDNSPEGWEESNVIKHGFGYLWRNEPTVHNGLGQPTTEERAAGDFTIQDFDGGVIFTFDDDRRYTFVLFNDNGTWREE